MASTRYNQKNLTLTIDGVTIQDFHEGASVTFSVVGGEVEITEGADGGGMNMATKQGAKLTFTLRETSRSRKFLADLRARQYMGGAGVTVILRTGADVHEVMNDAIISEPGEYSTGDKRQGGIQYTMISVEHSSSNMGMESLVSSGLSAVGALI